MPVTASQAWREAAASRSSDPMLLTLGFHHSTFGENIYVVANTENMAFKIEDGATLDGGQTVTFQAVPFTFDAPKIGAGGGAEWNIAVDNIGREISQYLPAATELNEPILVTLRGYMASRPNEVGWGPYNGEARSVAVSGTVAQMTVTIADPQNRRFGRKVYDLVAFPSLQAVS
ncbi:MAG: hypothetical protein JWQ03_3229 [Variovorax sp.]|nr:hypothetical protein [Variovorax sp.]